MTDKTWFSHLLRHPVRKWRGSILRTPDPREVEPFSIVGAESFTGCIAFILSYHVYHSTLKGTHKERKSNTRNNKKSKHVKH